MTHEDSLLKPNSDQWEFLETVERNSEEAFDSIIDLNNLGKEKQEIQNNVSLDTPPKVNNYTLPICMRKILSEGVTFDQRMHVLESLFNLKELRYQKNLQLQS